MEAAFVNWKGGAFSAMVLVGKQRPTEGGQVCPGPLTEDFFTVMMCSVLAA
jgi:hypothetical protein